MVERSKRIGYSIHYKLQLIDYAKEHGKRASARVLGPVPTEENDICLVTARKSTKTN